MSPYKIARAAANYPKNTHGFYVDLPAEEMAGSVADAAQRFPRAHTEIEDYGFEVWGKNALGVVHIASYCKADGGLCIHIV